MSCTCVTRSGQILCRMEEWQRRLDWAIERGREEDIGLARSCLVELDEAGCRKEQEVEECLRRAKSSR